MRSIIEMLGTGAFPRLRVGIGRPVHGEPPGHVLSDFTPDERIVMDGSLDQAVAAVETFIATDIRAAMNRYNVPPEDIAPDAEELAPPTSPVLPTPPTSPTPPDARGAVARKRGGVPATRGAAPPRARDAVAIAETQDAVARARGAETERDKESSNSPGKGASV